MADQIQKYSLEEVGARVRSRNPESFRGFSDREIGERVIARKPELAAIVQETAETTPPVATSTQETSSLSTAPSDRTALQKTGGMLRDIARGVVKPIAQLPIQYARTVASNVAGAAGFEDAATRLSKPVNVPFLGEIKTLGYGATPEARQYTATPNETVAQALDIAASTLPGGKGILGGLRTGAKVGALSGAAEALRKPGATAKDLNKGIITGGALGGFFGGGASAVGAVTRGVKNVVSPDVEKALLSAIKPAKSIQNFKESLHTTVKEIAPEAPRVTSLKALSDVIRSKKQQVWADVTSKLSDTPGGAQVNLGQAADTIEKMANKPIYKLGDGGQQEALVAMANRIRGVSLNPIEAEDILEDLNARASAYYRKNNIGRAAAEKADPSLAADLAIADTIRGELDRLVNGLGQAKKIYGALATVGQAVNDRIPVAERANITSLAEQVSAARTAGNVLGSLATGNYVGALGQAGDVLMASTLKGLEEADSKVKRAFAEVVKQNKPAGAILKKAREKVVSPVLGTLKRAAEIQAGKTLSK